jgi:hypothetical protein
MHYVACAKIKTNGTQTNVYILVLAEEQGRFVYAFFLKIIKNLSKNANLDSKQLKLSVALEAYLYLKISTKKHRVL